MAKIFMIYKKRKFLENIARTSLGLKDEKIDEFTENNIKKLIFNENYNCEDFFAKKKFASNNDKYEKSGLNSEKDIPATFVVNEKIQRINHANSPDSGYHGIPDSPRLSEDTDDYLEVEKKINEHFSKSLGKKIHSRKRKSSHLSDKENFGEKHDDLVTSKMTRKIVKKYIGKLEDKRSPVSGTIILDFYDESDGVSGDIDEALNVVETTDKAKREIAKIPNKIGDYVCRLCCEDYENAFHLARHRCSRIVNVEYKCPECGKTFNCPANLASHRRWHKPKDQMHHSDKKAKTNFSDEKEKLPHICSQCGKLFKRKAYLSKHISTAHSKKPSPENRSKTNNINQNQLIPVNNLNNSKSEDIALPFPTDTKVLQHRCGFCNLSFADYTILLAHMTQKHPKTCTEILMMSELTRIIPSLPISSTFNLNKTVPLYFGGPTANTIQHNLLIAKP